jgi:hypothetical protein
MRPQNGAFAGPAVEFVDEHPDADLAWSEFSDKHIGESPVVRRDHQLSLFADSTAQIGEPQDAHNVHRLEWVVEDDERERALARVTGARVWEKQKRGLAHLHGVVSVESSTRGLWAKAYITALRDLAPAYGFGFVDGWHKVGRRFWPGVQAAAYLSSYFAGGRGRKMAITENVLAGDLPRLVVFVGRDLTRVTGCTMRSLRDARELWGSRQGIIGRPKLGYEGGWPLPECSGHVLIAYRGRRRKSALEDPPYCVVDLCGPLFWALPRHARRESVLTVLS